MPRQSFAYSEVMNGILQRLEECIVVLERIDMSHSPLSTHELDYLNQLTLHINAARSYARFLKRYQTYLDLNIDDKET